MERLGVPDSPALQAAMNSRQHRQAQAAIRAAALKALAKVSPVLDLARVDETWPAFETGALTIVRRFGRVSAGLAHAYYRVARRAAGISGEPPPLQATPTTAQILAGLRAMGPLNARRQLGLGRELDDVLRTTLVNLEGVVSKYTLDHGRDVLLNAVKADSQARGWQRESSGNPCDFCAMLADRGVVHKSEAAADFESHRHCACSATPVW